MLVTLTNAEHTEIRRQQRLWTRLWLVTHCSQQMGVTRIFREYRCAWIQN